MNTPQQMIRGGNDPDLSWTFIDAQDQPVSPLPDYLLLVIDPLSSPRIVRDNAAIGGLVVDRVNATVIAPFTVADSAEISKGQGTYTLWGETSGRRRAWAAGTFTVREAGE